VTSLLVVVGARPNFMKAASLITAARGDGVSTTLVHTGQHYDPELSRVFFDELGLPEPDTSLGVGSGTHAQQTARIMAEFEPVLKQVDPALVVVVGDVNSTLACGLVAIKEHYPVAHVEAGLRCFDPWMPEEINRRLTDHLATLLFTTSADADANLAAEGVPPDRVHLVGNTMIDTLLRFREAARARSTADRLGLDGRPYALLTLHRPNNVDDLGQLTGVMDAVLRVGELAQVVFPVHPRTGRRLAGTRLRERLESDDRIVLTDPLGYVDFISLVDRASLVLTDSGGIQEETTVLGIPCLTLRESTERPVTVTSGTNIVVGTDADLILSEAAKALTGGRPEPRVPALWDGRAGERILAVIQREVLRPAASAASARS
jgi:UDP-N-acetylglucosamine 2-epimerase (non-hydrolysing)